MPSVPRSSPALLFLSLLVASSALAGTRVGSAARQPRLSPHGFRKLVDSTRGSLVRLVASQGTGVIIGVRGELLVPEEALGAGPLTVEYKGQRLEATVRERDRSLGLALLALPEGDYPAATVGSASRLVPGSFLLGLALDGQGRLKTVAGAFSRATGGDPAPRMRTTIGGPPGFVAFNARGELVGVHVPRRGAVVTVEAIRARFVQPRSEG